MIPPSTPVPTDAGALADWIDETRREAEKRGDKEQANLLWRTGNVISHGSHTTYPSRDIAQSVRDVVRDLAAALRNSAPQETRGDEPVAWRWRTRPEDNWGFSTTRLSLNDIGRTAPTFQEVPLYAAPQQSPRLEREALEAAERELTDLARPICCVYNRTAKKYEFTDAHIAQALPGTFEVIRQIRAALLSPDTSVVSSTSQVSPGFTQCAHCWQPATCKKYGCSEPVSSNHPREVSK